MKMGKRAVIKTVHTFGPAVEQSSHHTLPRHIALLLGAADGLTLRNRSADELIEEGYIAFLG
ncbi:hypothetical protein C5C66_10630 [Rathayibacter toxicus]|uniref:Uncharacterized protein n=1 Tax=Rathayibacter toxicus TaxID=145458 RepID=A0A0C5BQ94_9MICO|nr:hypothetical protein TI83_00170 [Rathayibacter toxicus]ALS57428.1 hypothetical protein APU90_06310 [Rathayibacter toxicus]KKM44455.1 hypothetical protein VT73_09815 [Rathayibacter toxicus]PPG20907.1 hypothetical protein C5D15_10620 [Rathayibacter toxicus]PPG46011.1 hypothetical protein C5D16_10595 [Rathayibacter toxicus]